MYTAIDKLNGIDFNNLEECTTFISTMVNSMWRRFHPNRKDSPEELSWDCYVHFTIKKYFEKYNPEITNKMYFIKVGVRNYLIDKERKMSRTIKTVSGDKEIGEGITLFSFIDSRVSDSTARHQMLEEIVSLLKEEKSWGVERSTPVLGETKLSHYAVLIHILKGWKPIEIAEMFKISVNRVHGIIREGAELLKNKYEVERLVENNVISVA